jgi:hypothetical protein
MRNFAQVAAALSAVAVAAALIGACSSGTNTFQGSTVDEAGTSPAPDGSTRDGATADARPDQPACTPNPACDRLLCECSDAAQSVMTTDGVCLADGSCDQSKRCTAACGALGFTGGAFVQKACSGEGTTCFASQPNVSCQCRQGFGVDTYARCTKGFCSSAGQDTCPTACASQGGWSCSGAEDCTPMVCACKDGSVPAVAGACQGTSCAPSSVICPNACGARGGWAGSSSGTPDAGPTGPKKPGDPCTSGTECEAFNCGCNDGTKFNGIRSCQNKTCPTKAQACGTTCLSSGGWDGL